MVDGLAVNFISCELLIQNKTDGEFVMRGQDVILRKLSGGRRGNTLIEQMRGRAGTGLSTDEIMKLTRK